MSALRRIYTIFLLSVANGPKSDSLVFGLRGKMQNSARELATIRSEISAANDWIALAIVACCPI
jgi:hypothetical protein